MPSLQISPKAESDLQAIGDYIALDNPRRAITFIDEIRNRCRLICAHPLGYPRRPEIGRDIRMALHGPYLILFRVLNDVVRIERVLHGARQRPKKD